MFQIISSKDGYDASNIMEFDDQQFYNIVKFTNNLSVNEFDIYDILYKSKYQNFPSSLERDKLNSFLEQIKTKNSNILTVQNKGGYEWVYVGKQETKNISYRYYFGINPSNLYKLVAKLSEKFGLYNVPVSFKYQKEIKKYNTDRIILYTDTIHKKEVERVINEVYEENKELFEGSERALPWIYESNTQNVFIAPESVDHSKSFGQNFANSLMDSKKVFHYLYQVDKVQDKSQLESLKKIVISSMLKNGVLLSKSGNRLIAQETGITTIYNKDKNRIKSVLDDKKSNYYEIEYDETIEGKKAFLKNFYSIMKASLYPGMKPRKLTREQRNMEIYNFLYPGVNNDKKNRI